MVRAILIVFLILSTTAGYTNKPDSTRIFNHYIGLGAGFTTACGISYKISGHGLAIQTNMGGLKYSKDFSSLGGGPDLEKFYYINLGIALFKKLKCNKDIMYSLYVAGQIWGHEVDAKENYYHTYDYSFWEEFNKAKLYNKGFGLAVEPFISSRIFLNIMFGVGQIGNKQDIYPTGEISLHYKL